MKTSFVWPLTVALFVLSWPLAAQEYAPVQPTEHHEVLKYDLGTWDADVTIWPAGPDSDPLQGKATETNKMFGEFWVESHFEYEIMNQKMTGHGSFGYDPTKKKFVGLWLESASPYMSTMEGTFDEETRTMTMYMEGKDPTGAETKGKIVSVQRDDNHKTFTMYMLSPGTEDEYTKFMQIKYKRRQ